MKKKILIADPISFKGHVNYNYGMINAICAYYDVAIISNNWMKKKLVEKGIPEDCFVFTYSDDYSIERIAKRHKNKALYHLLYRIHLLEVYDKIRQISVDYEAIIMTSIDIYSFSLISNRFNGNTLIIDHAIGELDTSRYYRKAWNNCNNSVKLIVLEEYIQEMTRKYMPERGTYVIHHPLPELEATNTAVGNKAGRCFVFAPSGSNDMNFIDSLIKQANFGNAIIMIKGVEEYKSDNLTVYNKRLSDAEYLNCFQKADYILLPYSNQYNYRTSAVLFEAATARKRVLIHSNNTLHKYKDRFPEQIDLFDTLSEMIEIINKRETVECRKYDLSEYTTDALAFSIKKAVEG